MGMLFPSQAVLYLQNQLSNQFGDPSKLAVWAGSSDAAVGFRDSLDASKKKKAPTLGPITLEYLNLIIPDSGDGETPHPDPSNGKSYKRWLIFWHNFRNKFASQYNALIDEVMSVLNLKEPTVQAMKFAAVEAASDAEVGIGIDYYTDLTTGYYTKRFTLWTKNWTQT
jgi:hypothetical protein